MHSCFAIVLLELALLRIWRANLFISCLLPVSSFALMKCSYIR